jgi:hypothetical protein
MTLLEKYHRYYEMLIERYNPIKPAYFLAFIHKYFEVELSFIKGVIPTLPANIHTR